MLGAGPCLPSRAEGSPLDVRELLAHGRDDATGTIAAKLLKGAKPADMPVEQPTKFELVVNTRTAKAIGINLSPSLLVRADEVVD